MTKRNKSMSQAHMRDFNKFLKKVRAGIPLKRVREDYIKKLNGDEKNEN